MDMSSSHNIFDEASKKRTPPTPKKNILSETPTPSPIIYTPEYLESLDTQKLLDQIKEMQLNLDKKRDDLKDALDSSPEKVIKYFNDPKNFTPEQWNIIQQNRSDLEKNVWSVIGKDPKKVREKQISDKQDKQRKGKSVGARHGWINMH